MPETRGLPSMIDAAERAAAVGDFDSAEKLLREAAARQEADLGPSSPDLANTLNNLAIVCEKTGKPGEAERFYRRAAAIAASSLDPSHPFVATSRKNLEEFCAARGVPAQTRRVSRRPLAIGAVSIGVIAVVALAAWGGWLDATPAPPASAPAPNAAAPPPVLPPSSPARSTARPAPRTSALLQDPPTVVSAGLCRSLATGVVDWDCDRVSSPVDAGALVFYTRLTSARDATVRHRWYRDNQLLQTVELRIRANLGRGYRTYSRRVVDRGAGEWRVELVSQSGVVLHQERFVVR